MPMRHRRPARCDSQRRAAPAAHLSSPPQQQRGHQITDEGARPPADRGTGRLRGAQVGRRAGEVGRLADPPGRPLPRGQQLLRPVDDRPGRRAGPLEEVAAQPGTFRGADVVGDQLVERPQQAAAQEHVVPVALVHPEIEHQTDPAATADGLQARGRGHRQQQVDPGQDLADGGVVDPEVRRSVDSRQQVLRVVLHGVEGVLPGAVPWLEQHLALGVRGRVVDQPPVEMEPLGRRTGHRRLVGEDDAADRVVALGQGRRPEDRQPRQQQVVGLQLQLLSHGDEVLEIVDAVDRDDVGADAVQIARGDLLDDHAHPAGDHHRTRLAGRHVRSEVDGEAQRERPRQPADHDVAGRGPAQQLGPADRLDPVEPGGGDLAGRECGADVGHQDLALEAPRHQLVPDAGDPLELGVESRDQQGQRWSWDGGARHPGDARRRC